VGYPESAGCVWWGRWAEQAQAAENKAEHELALRQQRQAKGGRR